MDWQTWHGKYDTPHSRMAERLRTVQAQIDLALNSCDPGPIRVISLCAGQGRDLLEVLQGHPRRNDVQARLVELDRRNTEFAERLASSSGLHQIEVMTADASISDHYRGMTPAHLVLICGLFGNIHDGDIERTIDRCPQLCATGGRVIWTRHRRKPDRVPMICRRFEGLDFEQHWLSAPETELAVGVHQFRGKPSPLVLGERMFTFVGYDKLKS